MHYRDRPASRPTLTLERISAIDLRSMIVGLCLLCSSATVALFAPIGADLYCTRDGRSPSPARCVEHRHTLLRTVQRSLPVTEIDASIVDRRRSRSADEEPLSFDGRWFRDRVGAHVHRGRWSSGWSEARASAAAFFDERSSAAFFLRERAKNSAWVMAVTVGAMLLSVPLLWIASLKRRRYRIRFDRDQSALWFSKGTLLRMRKESATKLLPNESLEVGHLKLTPRSIESSFLLAKTSSGDFVFHSVHREDEALFDALARAFNEARNAPDELADLATNNVPRTSTPWLWTAPAWIASLLMIATIHHGTSLPPSSGTVEFRATTRCQAGGMSILAYGVLRKSLRAGPYVVAFSDDRGRSVDVHFDVAPGATTTLVCSEAMFAKGAL